MKLTPILLVILTYSSLMSAQLKTIQLPNVDIKVGMIQEPHFDIYVTKDNTIIYEKDTIKIHQIKELLYQPTNDYGINNIYMSKQIHLFVDKNVKYSLIDSIKTEISCTNSSKYIIYRSNINLKNSRDIKGIKHKSPMSYYNFSPPEYLKTQRELKERDSIEKSHANQLSVLPIMPDLPTENQWNPIVSVERAIYSLQQEIIDEALQGKSYQCLTISNRGIMNAHKEILPYEKDNIEKLLMSQDVIILNYEKDLSYENYIIYIKTLQAFMPNFVSKPNYAEVVEISNQIRQLHKKAKIELCD